MKTLSQWKFPQIIKRVWRPVLVFLVVCGLWGSRMPFVAAYYQRTLLLGYYPPNADSITIPIVSEAIVTAVVFPFLIIALLLALYNFPARCSWLAWERKKLFRSYIWTLLTILFIWQMVPYIQEHLEIGLPRNAWFDGAWIVVALELRAIVVSKLSVQPL